MMFTLACGDVMPGCASTFTDADTDSLLDQVAAHAAADHGIVEMTPEIRAQIESKVVAA